MTQPIALITFEQFPDLTPDDRLALAALEAAGQPVEALRWVAADVDWGAYAALVVRSTWDYHTRLDEFRAWLDRVEQAGVPVWNPIDILRWNMDKLYLQDLEENGVAVTPSVWLPKGAKPLLADLLAQKEWERAVVKPRVSASADDTFVVTAADAAEKQAEFVDLLSRKALLVQPFMEELTTEGEWSLLFFDKQFSHAVLKRPAEGDFRVQIQFGGREQALRPPEPLIAQAQSLLDEVEAPLLYARVDGVNRRGQFILMELELIEPVLFFGHDEKAAGRFAEAAMRYLSEESQA